MIFFFFSCPVETLFFQAVSVYMTSSEEAINPGRSLRSSRDSQAPVLKTIIDQKQTIIDYHLWAVEVIYL